MQPPPKALGAPAQWHMWHLQIKGVAHEAGEQVGDSCHGYLGVVGVLVAELVEQSARRAHRLAPLRARPRADPRRDLRPLPCLTQTANQWDGERAVSGQWDGRMQ
eukprot:797030-Prorocentrum_minimum.AAC.1